MRDIMVKINNIDNTIQNDEIHNNTLRTLLAKRSFWLHKLKGIDALQYSRYLESLKRIAGKEGKILKALMPSTLEQKLNTKMIYTYRDLLMIVSTRLKTQDFYSIENAILSLVNKGYLAISSDGGMICLMPIGTKYLLDRYGDDRIITTNIRKN